MDGMNSSRSTSRGWWTRTLAILLMTLVPGCGLHRAATRMRAEEGVRGRPAAAGNRPLTSSLGTDLSTSERGRMDAPSPGVDLP